MSASAARKRTWRRASGKRKFQVQSPRSKVQGPKSLVQSLRSQAVGLASRGLVGWWSGLPRRFLSLLYFCSEKISLAHYLDFGSKSRPSAGGCNCAKLLPRFCFGRAEKSAVADFLFLTSLWVAGSGSATASVTGSVKLFRFIRFL
jgi:hypothetical protein